MSTISRIGYARVSTQSQDLGQQLELLKEAGCSLLFGEKVSSPASEHKRLELQAEVERSLIQERTRESVEHRRKTGGNLGGRPALPESRRSLVLRLRNEGKSYREISESTGCALSTAHKICFQEAAKGTPNMNSRFAYIFSKRII